MGGAGVGLLQLCHGLDERLGKAPGEVLSEAGGEKLEECVPHNFLPAPAPSLSRPSPHLQASCKRRLERRGVTEKRISGCNLC